MPRLTEEERKERKRVYLAEHYAKNREQRQEEQRQRYAAMKADPVAHKEHREKARARRVRYLTEKRDDQDFLARRRAVQARSRAKNREKNLEAAKRYRREHLEERKEYRVRHYAEHREDILAREKRYRTEHPERRREIDGRSYAKHRDKRRARSLSYRHTHVEQGRAYSRKYQLNNLAKFAAYASQRRAVKLAAPIDDFDDSAQWQEVLDIFKHRCAYCGMQAKGRLTRDHITPLTKQGSHTLHNIVPACQHCNSKKGNRESLAPVQPLLLTLAPARKKKGS